MSTPEPQNDTPMTGTATVLQPFEEAAAPELTRHTLYEVSNTIGQLTSMVADAEDIEKGALIDATAALSAFHEKATAIKEIGSVDAIKQGLKNIVTRQKRRGDTDTETLVKFIRTYKNAYTGHKDGAADLLKTHDEAQAKLDEMKDDVQRILNEHGSQSALDETLRMTTSNYDFEDDIYREADKEMSRMRQGSYHYDYSTHVGDMIIYIGGEKLGDETYTSYLARKGGVGATEFSRFVKKATSRKANVRVKKNDILGKIQAYDRTCKKREERALRREELRTDKDLLTLQSAFMQDYEATKKKMNASYAAVLKETATVLSKNDELCSVIMAKDPYFMNSANIAQQKDLRLQIVSDMQEFLNLVMTNYYEPLKNLEQGAFQANLLVQRVGLLLRQDDIIEELDTVHVDLSQVEKTTSAALSICRAVQVYLQESEKFLDQSTERGIKQEHVWKTMSDTVLARAIMQKQRIAKAEQKAIEDEYDFDPTDVPLIMGAKFTPTLISKAYQLCETEQEGVLMSRFMEGTQNANHVLADSLRLDDAAFSAMDRHVEKLRKSYQMAQSTKRRTKRSNPQSMGRAFNRGWNAY